MASLTGELKPGCLVQINMRTQKVRDLSFAIFLGRLPCRSYEDWDGNFILRFLMPDGTFMEFWEDIFETSAHVWVRVIQETN